MQSKHLLLGALLVCLFLVWHGRTLPRRWPHAQGYEYEWVAEPLAKGHGYTFEDRQYRWLGPFDEDYAPTAWIEPVQTLIMAGSFRTFGDSGRLLLVALNFVWFALACYLVYELGRYLLSPTAGLVAAVLLAALPLGKEELLNYIGNSALAAFLITLCALSLVRSLEQVGSLRRGLVLGAILGLTCLTHAVTILFIPVSATCLVATSSERTKVIWSSAAAVVMAAWIVMMPWTLRNWAAFGQLVLVRTGLGQNLHYAMPAFAQTFTRDLELGGGWSDPPWTARDGFEALSEAMKKERWRQLMRQSIRAVKANAPDNWQSLNEAQRDALFLQGTKSFVSDHPVLVLRMMVIKAVGFFFSNWRGTGALTFLAFLGVVVTVRDWRAVAVAVLVVSYGFLYTIGIPIYYRYRAPIEPLIVLFVGLLAGTFLQHFQDRWQGRSRLRNRREVLGQKEVGKQQTSSGP